MFLRRKIVNFGRYREAFRGNKNGRVTLFIISSNCRRGVVRSCFKCSGRRVVVAKLTE